jgi:hypothetical protein
MKNKPFLELFMLFLMVALVVSNLWSLFFEGDRSPSAILTFGLAVVLMVVGFIHSFRKKLE